MGDPIAVEVLSASAITGAGAVSPNGWVAAVTFKGMATAQTFDATKLSLTVQGPGFDATGAAATVTRTITGTSHLRKPLPQTYAAGLTLAVGDRVVSKNKISSSTRIYSVTAGGGVTADATGPVNTSGTSTLDGITYTYLGDVNLNPAPQEKLYAVSGSDIIVYAALSDDIFASETVTGCAIGAGAYGASNASTASFLTLTNSSAATHWKPHVCWVTPPWQISSTSMRLEVAVSHPKGQSGRMAACVIFKIYNSSNTLVLTTSAVTAMTQSAISTGGKPVPVFGATVDISGLSDGLLYATAEVYPFHGASFLTATHGFGSATPTISTIMPGNTAKAIPFRKDAAGTFGRIYAYVAVAASTGGVGNDGTGVASATAATAAAAPFATISAAAAAIQTASNSTLSRNNVGNHEIRLVGSSGGAQVTFVGFHGSSNTMSSRASGDVWLTLTRDPATTTTKADVALTPGGSQALRIPSKRLKVYDITLTGTSAAVVIDGAASASIGDFQYELWFDACTLTGGGSARRVVTSAGWTIYTNCTLDTIASQGNENSRQAIPLVAGCTITGNSFPAAINALGNVWSVGANPQTPIRAWWNDNSQVVDTFIYLANSFPSITANLSLPKVAVSRGVSIVQTLIETYNSAPSIVGGQFSADLEEIAIPQLWRFYCTVAGDGANVAYNDGGGAGGVTASTAKVAVQIFNAEEDRNMKHDYHDDTAKAHGARVGNFRSRYNVGSRKNALFAQVGAPDASATALVGEVLETGSFLTGTRGWTTDKSKTGDGLGGGNYVPTTSSSAKSMIGAAEQMLPFDLNGTTRKTDGTGAVGALEWA